jgi:hypothetical protein
MKTNSYLPVIGGDWTALEPVELRGELVDVYRSQGKNCNIDIAVYNGIVYLRAFNDDMQEYAEYEQHTEDDAVRGDLLRLRTSGVQQLD